jgi:hypothetical protein
MKRDEALEKVVVIGVPFEPNSFQVPGSTFHVAAHSAIVERDVPWNL